MELQMILSNYFIVDMKWIIETRSFHQRYGRWAAASEAVQIYLPQDQESRITFGVGMVDGNTGLGLGYAFKNDDGVAFTLGIGTSGGEDVGKASVGFEFGGSSKKSSGYIPFSECSYVKGELNFEQKCIKEKE